MNAKKPRNNCLNCGKECLRRPNIYCNNKCYNEHQQKQYIKRWKEGKEDGSKKPDSISNYVRRYLLEKYDNKCKKCGWGEKNPTSNRIPLTVHHKNGNWMDCREDNLEVLCPNCHSLTENYGIYNKGNGRKDRPTARKSLA